MQGNRGKVNEIKFEAVLKTKMAKQDPSNSNSNNKITEIIDVIDLTKEDNALMIEKSGRNIIANGKTMYRSSTNPLGAMNIVEKLDTFDTSSIIKYFTRVDKLCDDYFDSNAHHAFSPESEHMFSTNVSALTALAEPRKISARTKIDWSNTFLVTPVLFHRSWCRVLSLYIDWTSHIPELHQLSLTDQVRLVMDRAVPCIDILVGYKAAQNNVKGMMFSGGAYLPRDDAESVDPSMKLLMKDFGDFVYDEFTEPAKKMNLTVEEYTLLKLLVFLTPVPGLSPEGTKIIKNAHRFYSEILKQQIRQNSPTPREFFDRMCAATNFLSVIEQSISYCDKGFSVMSLFNIANMKGELTYEVHIRKGSTSVPEK
uniref:NR LBD domain-containing protein n=1 Tax=Panagrolaimus sp. ES5 TaxID=591445 RepID=A0AC34H036_9BILA